MSAALRSTGHGIESRVPYAGYSKLPGVSITRLKNLARSPKRYLYELANPTQSEPLKLGSATHVSILEPERFDRDHAVWGEREEEKVRRGKVYDAFEAAALARGITEDRIITVDQRDLALGMRNAVRSNPAAMRYLEEGDPEVTLRWQDEETSTECKGRVDWLTREGGMPVLVGLKTARDCRHFLFGTQAARLKYHLQWAYYFDGHQRLTGKAAKVVEIVVENTPPFDVAVFVITSDIIEQGRQEYRELLVRLGECKARNEWPGAVPEEEPLTLPSWAYQQDDDISDLGLEA